MMPIHAGGAIGLPWRLVAVLIGLAAGASAYLFFLNRFLIQLRDARYKSLVIRGGGLLALVGSGIGGYCAAGTRWLLLPAGVLGLVALGEARRGWERWRWRAAAPVIVAGRCASWREIDRTTCLAFAHYTLPVPGWTGPALRIAHVSDLHVNRHPPLSYFEQALDRVAAAQPDLIFYTGDFVTHRAQVALLPPLLQRAQGRLGTFGVLGNHDDWAGRDAVAAAVTAGGVILLGQGEHRLALGDGREIGIYGCEAPWSDFPCETSPGPADRPAFILTHTPDNIYQLAQKGFTAVFAGHYHAGQMRLPLVGALVVPSRYGRRFDHGHFCVAGTHLFVTAGVGSAEPPIRLWCQPDIFIVDIHGAGDTIGNEIRLSGL